VSVRILYLMMRKVFLVRVEFDGLEFSLEIVRECVEEVLRRG